VAQPFQTVKVSARLRERVDTVRSRLTRIDPHRPQLRTKALFLAWAADVGLTHFETLVADPARVGLLRSPRLIETGEHGIAVSVEQLERARASASAFKPSIDGAGKLRNVSKYTLVRWALEWTLEKLDAALDAA
jgi:hypothetical protein